MKLKQLVNLLMNNSFSKYVHYFYFLSFIGNLKNSPFFITLCCAAYGCYDFTVLYVDYLYCKGARGDTILYSYLQISMNFKICLSLIILVYWVLICTLPSWILKKINILSLQGRAVKFIIVKCLCCKRLKKTQDLLNSPFKYPLRIKAAGFVALFIISITCILICITVYAVYNIIDALQSCLNWLEKQPDDDVFIYLKLENDYVFTVDTGKQLTRFLIYLLIPIFPCTVVSFGLGFLITLASILNMFYQYKRIILKIKEEGEESETLKFVWKFKSYNTIYFCSQFIINTFFLTFVFAITIFIAAYCVSFKEILKFILEYLLKRPWSFWISFIPTILGMIYFPFLIENSGFVKNKTYFCLWDTWYFLIGTLGAFLKVTTRFIIAFISLLLLGFRVETSIIPVPLDEKDTLYVGFYATIAMHCMKDGIIPKNIRQELLMKNQSYLSLNEVT
ncbi:hypothetical protein SteCoe_25016 [Stentor coeruleus]|uniref:Uncharacterized protein n=1 Tax=Stentor coeruleus TaxID=5963 RepID=A0A1R2BG60_9CILI|nr:hypothetical protein SteCoe_25016 [Stentor coeruleus]